MGNAQNKVQFYSNDCPWILLSRRESNTFCVDNVILEKTWFSINNGNWTKWSAIWAEIICVISKSNECTAWVWFEITSMISDQNCTTQGSITTLLHPFHFEITQIQDLVSSNILLLQHWAGLKLNSSMQNLPCNTLCLLFPAIWLVTLNKPWNLIGCFVFSVASSLAGKKMQFKAKNGAICE